MIREHFCHFSGRPRHGKYYLSGKLKAALKDFTDEMISTESLGLAFEPEQAFENPDGTPIIFDKDYFGNHRPITPAPGPFASYGDEDVLVMS